MRVKTAALLVSVAVAGAPTDGRAQSADKVLERYIEAIGGTKAVERVNSTDLSGSVSSADGRSGVFTQRTRRPHSFYVSLSWGDARWRAGFNGRAAWSAGTPERRSFEQDDGLAELQTLYGQPAARVRAEASIANTKYAGLDRVLHLSVAGREQLRGREVIVLLAVTPDGLTRRLFFDAASYLLVKDQEETEAGLEQRFYDDYRKLDGVMEPHRIEWHRHGESLRIAIEHITHNVPLDAQVFDVPVRESKPAVDLDVILSAAERNESRVDGLRDAYTYTQTSTSGRVDDSGRVTQQEGQTFEVFHLGGRMVTKLIRDRGQALSEAERRREDERVKKIVQEYERQRLSGPAAPRVQARPGSGMVLSWGPLGRSLPAYRRLSQFSHVRRERLEERGVIVVEFEPGSGAAPNGDLERQAGKLAGTLWIDDASQYVIRIDAYFRDEENRNVEGSSLRQERTLVNEEVWLPSRLEMNLRRSWAFGKLSTMLGATEYTGYKKFTVETDATVTLPDPGR